MGSVEYHLRDGWKRLEVTRKNGIYAGKADIYIYSPDGSKFRSKKELHTYLTSNNLPYKVEELFTATDASGSKSSSKAADKGKKANASEKLQKASVPEKQQKANASERPQRVSLPERPQRASVPERPQRSSVLERQQRSSAPERAQRISVPERPQRASVPERQPLAAEPERPQTLPSASSTAQKRPAPQVPDSVNITSAGNSGSSGASGTSGTPGTSATSAIPGTSGTSQPAPTAAPPSQRTPAPEPASPGPSAKRHRPASSGNSSPFIQTPYGNPSFAPQRLGTSNAEAQALKPPKAPERPLMPYMRYSRTVWEMVKAQNPDLKLWEIGRIIGQQWRDLPNELKREYVEEYEMEKAEYERALRIYLNSPAYQNYLRAKNRAGSSDENRELHERQVPESTERRIDIQPAEDEDEIVDVYPARAMAYARYIRNHRLMCQIFGEAVVPEMKVVVTTLRVEILRRQVLSLRMHQNKLLSELREAKETFKMKKMKMNDSHMRFEEEMKKYSCQVDDETFEKMVEDQYEMLKMELINDSAECNTAPELEPSFTPEAYGCFESHFSNSQTKNVGPEEEAAAAAAAIAAVLILPGAEDLEPGVPPTANISLTPAANSVHRYSGMGNYPSAHRGHYPVQPSNVPAQAAFDYPFYSQLGDYMEPQPSHGDLGSFSEFRHSRNPRQRHRHFFEDPRYDPRYRNVAPTGMSAAENSAILEQSLAQNVPPYNPESEQAPGGQQEWE